MIAAGVTVVIVGHVGRYIREGCETGGTYPSYQTVRGSDVEYNPASVTIAPLRMCHEEGASRAAQERWPHRARLG